jgi:FkbM family methyltransferase
MILRDLFGSTKNGFFVDVGAFHPRFGSNTYLLYRQGWHGVNIDARPGSMLPFRIERRRDMNLECAVGSVPGAADFYVFIDEELSTLDPEWASEMISAGHRLDQKVTTTIDSLAHIHAAYSVPPRYELLSVDCEGRDVDVLESNDWGMFRPQVIVVECAHRNVMEALESPAARYLRSVEYYAAACTRLSLVLIDRQDAL